MRTCCPLSVRLFLLAIPLVLSGCFSGSQLEVSLDDYTSRLAYVLDTDLPQPQKHVLPPLASTDTLIHHIAPVNINLREFHALNGCELNRLVALRNTSLGKSQLPSQRLVYESQVVAELTSCKNSVATSNPELANKLAQWAALKAQDFTLTWANVIQTSQELRLALNTPESLLSAENNKDALASINSLYFLNAVLPPNTNDVRNPVDSKELETQLHIIRSARLPATLWLTQQTLYNSLSELNLTLPAHLDAISCPEGRASEQAKILRNVFYLCFIKEIQPVGSVVNQYHYKLAPLWDDWMERESLRAQFRTYIRQNSEEGFKHYQDAMTTHVEMWQQFLKRCSLSPVAPS